MPAALAAAPAGDRLAGATPARAPYDDFCEPPPGVLKGKLANMLRA